MKQKRSDNEGRILNIVLELESHTHIINIYAPQTDSECRTFFSGLGNFIPGGGVLYISLGREVRHGRSYPDPV